MLQTAIAECAARFVHCPGRVSIWNPLAYWQVGRPFWLQENPSDPLETLFRHLHPLRQQGWVVWGRFVQVNQQLFEPGDSDCPGEVVYSLEHASTISPDALKSVAASIFSLKHTTPSDSAEAAIAHHLTNQRTRVFGLPVPASISPHYRCLISTILVFRAHLPEPTRYLTRGLMPLVVNPAPPHVAMILPAWYWPPALIDWWQSGA